MKFVLSVIVGLLLCPFLNAQRADLQPKGVVPRLVNFSGKEQDEEGKPLPGVISISFAIFKDQFEGAPLWMETQNATVDAEGNSPET